MASNEENPAAGTNSDAVARSQHTKVFFNEEVASTTVVTSVTYVTGKVCTALTLHCFASSANATRN